MLVVLAAAGYVAYRLHAGRNIHGSAREEFVTTGAAAPKPGRRHFPQLIAWPMYGRDAARLRTAEGVTVRPPFRRIWASGGIALLEFPPAVGYGRLYIANGDGVLTAFRARSGTTLWQYNTRRCVASSPAVSNRTVYATFLNHPPCNASSVTDGEIVALDALHGRVVWRRTIGPSESSPLVALGNVYVGDWRGNVYAFDARRGTLRWRFSTGDRVKGAVAFASGRVFFGSYDHHVYSLDARTGRLIWKASAQLGFGSSATFYSTPAIAYGRVYIGGTDGRVYSFGATSGKIRWSYNTGGYVYASPAVWQSRVFIGSYNHNFYCFDAATGDIRWTYHADGSISGSPTIVDGIVYFSTFKRHTYGLDARSGRLVWSFPQGAYSPIVADKSRLYLVGYSAIYALAPTRHS